MSTLSKKKPKTNKQKPHKNGKEKKNLAFRQVLGLLQGAAWSCLALVFTASATEAQALITDSCLHRVLEGTDREQSQKAGSDDSGAGTLSCSEVWSGVTEGEKVSVLSHLPQTH